MPIILNISKNIKPKGKSREPMSNVADRYATEIITESKKEGLRVRLIWSNMFDYDANNSCNIGVFWFSIAHKPAK